MKLKNTNFKFHRIS